MKKQYIQIGQIKKLRDVSLAFTVPDDLPPIPASGTTLVWTKQALKTFSDIHKAAYEETEKFKELPYQSLRGELNVNLKDITRIEPHLGLKSSLIRVVRSKNPQEYGFARLPDSNDDEKFKKRLRSILNNWLVNYLRPFCQDKNVLDNLLDQIQNLIEHNELIRFSTFGFNLLPWTVGENGTTEPEDYRAYTVVVDRVARLIAGKELFESCGPMRRIISSYGKFANSTAELITTPISIADKGRFSLVVKLQLVTFPSISQPIIKLDVSKRRWLDLLEAPDRDRRDISGYVFSSILRDRTFSFKVTCRKDNNEWAWKTEKDFGAIRRQLELGMQTFSGQDIVLGNADRGGSQIVLCHRNGLTKHGIDVGVPEVDKLEAYKKIEKIVSAIGLLPFTAYEPVENKSSKRQQEKEVKLPTLLSSLLQSSDSNPLIPTPSYINNLNDSQLNQQLESAFCFPIEAVKSGRKALQISQPKGSDFEELQIIRERNSSALERLHPGEKLSLFIFYQDGFQEELKFLTALAQLLWGESIEIVTNSLPPNTHGSRHDLPNPKEKAQERSKQRIKAWESTANQLAKREGRTFCLVLAAKFFKAEDGTDKRDDPINKPSTRRALASMCGACVQFITQMDRTKKHNKIDLVDSARRGQQALKDLLSAHSGRVESIKDKVDECLKVPSASKPKEIIAITIVRKQKGRVRGRIESTFLPIAIRIQVETERCEMRCAYAIENKLKLTEWEKFPDALARIANISPVKIGNNHQIRKRNFMQFVRDVISPSVAQEMQPLVMIDSTNCVQLWPWLADVRINATNIQLEGVSDWMHKEWAGARLVRIKQGFTPAIIEEKVRYIMESSTSDERSLDELKQLDADIAIPSSSSTPGKLFRLITSNQTGCIAYLSVGSKAVQQEWRGQSCYRSIPAYIPIRLQDINEISEDDIYEKRPKKRVNAAGIEMRKLSEKPPFIKQWPTPNPLEILVTLLQHDDDPDQVAALVESLRYVLGHYAESTTLPAPLFFERVVRDYISDFSIEEESEDES
ncbi:MAG: RNaseH domain-containing protein [Cyanobacteria bacterium J06555_13]